MDYWYWRPMASSLQHCQFTRTLLVIGDVEQQTEDWRDVNIATKELVIIILAMGTWGHQLEEHACPVSVRQHGCSGSAEGQDKP